MIISKTSIQLLTLQYVPVAEKAIRSSQQPLSEALPRTRPWRSCVALKRPRIRRPRRGGVSDNISA